MTQEEPDDPVEDGHAKGGDEDDDEEEFRDAEEAAEDMQDLATTPPSVHTLHTVGSARAALQTIMGPGAVQPQQPPQPQLSPGGRPDAWLTVGATAPPPSPAVSLLRVMVGGPLSPRLAARVAGLGEHFRTAFTSLGNAILSVPGNVSPRAVVPHAYTCHAAQPQPQQPTHPHPTQAHTVAVQEEEQCAQPHAYNPGRLSDGLIQPHFSPQRAPAPKRGPTSEPLLGSPPVGGEQPGVAAGLQRVRAETKVRRKSHTQEVHEEADTLMTAACGGDGSYRIQTQVQQLAGGVRAGLG